MVHGKRKNQSCFYIYNINLDINSKNTKSDQLQRQEVRMEDVRLLCGNFHIKIDNKALKTWLPLRL